MNIPIIVGTTRKNRQSIKVAEFILSLVQKKSNISSQLIDPRDYSFESDGNDQDNKDPRYTEVTQSAQAFIIVVPEYNHSFPGSLKMLLDTELKNYIHKPVMLVGVSAGPWGGTRAVESLIHPLREMGMTTTFSDLYFPYVQDLFDEKGDISDDKYIKSFERSFEELIWMSQTMKWGRENIDSRYH